MHRKQLAILLVGLLTVTAGCGDIVGDSGSPTPAENATDDQATTTPTEGAMASAYTGEVNVSAIKQAHNETLDAVGTYTIVSNQTVETNQTSRSTFSSSRLTKFNLDSGAAYRKSNSSIGFTEEVYVDANGSAYKRTDQGDYGGVEYSEPSFPPTPEDSISASVLDVLGELNTTHETKEVDGETVHVYTANNVSEVPEEAIQQDENITFTNFEYRVEIIEGGNLKSFTYNLTAIQERNGEKVETTLALTQETKDVGSTTVEEPSWLDEAKEQMQDSASA